MFEIVLYRLRYKLSPRNPAEMFLLRGFHFTHEAVRDWEARFAPLLAEQTGLKYGGPLLYHGGEDHQRSFDSTCRKLRRFLTETTR